MAMTPKDPQDVEGIASLVRESERHLRGAAKACRKKSSGYACNVLDLTADLLVAVATRVEEREEARMEEAIEWPKLGAPPRAAEQVVEAKPAKPKREKKPAPAEAKLGDVEEDEDGRG